MYSVCDLYIYLFYLNIYYSYMYLQVYYFYLSKQNNILVIKELACLIPYLVEI